MIWMVFAAFFLLTACGALAAEELVLPEAGNLKDVTITASGLELTVDRESFIAELLQLLERSVKENSGRASVQDVPDAGAGLVRIDFGFRKGGASTVFLYREGEALLLEQPYQGIYELDGAMEEQFRARISAELARQPAAEQE